METKENIQASIRIILDFVERWNKQDNEHDVAEAAFILKNFVEDYFDNLIS